MKNEGTTRLADVRLPLDTRAFPLWHLAIGMGGVLLCVVAAFALMTHDLVVAPFVAMYFIGGLSIPVAYIYVIGRWAGRLRALDNREMRSDIGVTGVSAEDFLRVLLWIPLMRVLIAATILQVIGALLLTGPLIWDFPEAVLLLGIFAQALIAPWTACLHLLMRFERDLMQRTGEPGIWWASVVLLAFIHLLIGAIAVLALVLLFFGVQYVFYTLRLDEAVESFSFFYVTAWFLTMATLPLIAMVVLGRRMRRQVARIATFYFSAEE